jgi:hypothetical protein
VGALWTISLLKRDDGYNQPVISFVFAFHNNSMQIAQALEVLGNDNPIVLRDKTFQPRGVETVSLETGEKVYWVPSVEGVWLSLDPEGEEIILFEDIDEELEAEDDIVVYGGEDHELAYEGVATTSAEDGAKTMTFKDYASADGEIVRIMEEETTGDKTAAYGVKLTEEDLQEA